MIRPRLLLMHALASVSLCTSASVFATDYDYDAARRVYEQKQAETTAAQRRFDARQGQYNDANSELSSANADVSRINNEIRTKTRLLDQKEDLLVQKNNEIDRLEGDLQRLIDRNDELNAEIDRDRDTEDDLEDRIDRLETQIRNVQQRIRELERGDNGEDWTCAFRDRGQEEHRGGHRATNSDKATAREEARAACLEVHGECRLISCTQPDSDELRQLRQRLSNLQSRKQERERELTEVRNRIQHCVNELNRNRGTIRTIEGNLRTLRTAVANLERDIRDLEWDIESLQRDLARAEDRVSVARSDLSRAERDLEFAREDLQIASDQELSAKLYYEQVLQNYNTAIANARSNGSSQAAQHASREAAERVATIGIEAGRAAGVTSGRRVGNGEAVRIATAQGYQLGRRSGSSQDNLKPSYNAGSTEGQQWALNKAQVENFPAGYNEQMATILQGEPSNTLEVDITDQLPDAPDESSAQVLTPEMKAVGNKPQPQYTAPTEPSYRVPRAGRPSVDVPAPDKRHYDPECTGHDLPEFDAACRDAYDNTYVGNYGRYYRNEYTEVYTSGFNVTVENAYRTARSGERPAVYLEAAQKGAKEQGVLDGFATALPEQQGAQHLAGVQAFDQYLTTGFLPILGEVKLIEGYPDGNMSPGETVTLQMTIDNYGRQNSEQEILQVRLKELNGVELDVTLRKLPSLPSDTTMVLQGVLQGKLRAIVQDSSELSLTAVLEKDTGGPEGEVLDQATFTGSIRQPFNITSLSFGDAVGIGETGTGVLVVANRTNAANEPTEGLLASLSESITLGEAELEIPAIGAGEQAEIPFSFTPEVTAGGNQTVGLTLTAGNLAGGEIKLSASSVVPVARKGSLALCLPNCNDPIGGTRVRAGSSAFFPIRFMFHSDVRERGPFVIRKTGDSDDRIRAANNSTFSVNLGSWGPNSSTYTGRFGYVFPTELRGTSQWVQVSLLENGTEIHRLRIPVQVQ